MKVAYLFPGQGAQYVGMGKELAANFKVADEVFNQANDILGVDLKKNIFEGPEAELTLTNNSQPAIFVTSMACLAVMKQEGLYVEPTASAGLSLGEFTALHLAGVLDFQEALKLVRQRGTFMQEACEEQKGAMASIMGLEESVVRQICEEANQTALVDVANVNSPGQVVVSGSQEGVAKAVELADAQENSRTVLLNVAGAFHSRLMHSAREKLEKVLDKIPLKQPTFSLFFNVTGETEQNPDQIRRLLGEQVTSSVLWARGVQNMIQSGVTHFVEVGCGRVLSGLLKRIQRGFPSSNVEDLQSLEKTKEFIDLATSNK